MPSVHSTSGENAIRNAILVLTALLVLPALAKPMPPPAGTPRISSAQSGATIQDVSVEAYGSVRPATVKSYLSLHAGDKLEQAGVDHDYANLSRLGALRVRLNVSDGSAPNTVSLRWIVMAKWLKSTTHPFYADQPLSAPIQGVGFVLTAPPITNAGGGFSAYTQLSKRANLARVLFTDPIYVDPKRGRQYSIIVDAYGSRGVYRASQPYAINVYSWTRGEEALFYSQGTNGTQFEGGIRYTRSTNAKPTSIVATTLYRTDVAAARQPSIVAAISHACTFPAYEWRPPFCGGQFRLAAFDTIGGFGSTNQFHAVSADVARYFAIGKSTIALHASAVRSGGVLADSGLVCATVRGYPKPFCGTDAEGITAEYRINDATAYRRPFEWVLFTEDAASRVRGAEAYALPYFTWHPDSGIGLIYRGGFRFDLAGGQAGMRLTFELKGQLY
jgi:hypothetical protein